MCTVIVAWRCLPDAPLVVAANRDEMLARPSASPLLLQTHPPRWGGRDLVAGGTWLAVDPAGRVGAVTNRHPGGVYTPPDRTRASRGVLPLEVIAGTDADALALLTSLQPGAYNPVNVLYLSPIAAWWTRLDTGAGASTEPLTPGIHVITERDLDDPLDAKTTHIRHEAERALNGASGPSELVPALCLLLSTHGDLAACVHGPDHGTVSSSTVVVTADHHVNYQHADGPPCTTPYAAVL